ncbi:MAG: hypothetical protein GXP62_08960 [Oligoflexia bacterium]|nr:hypothetical protein [Oligoflexia bacterium]
MAGLIAATLQACTPPCQGAGCESTYDAALVGVLRGADQDSTGDLDPRQTWAELQGSSDQGPDWDVALIPGHLLVGIPASDVVADFDLGAGGDLSFSADQGRISDETPGDRLGAAVAVVGDQDGDRVAELLVGAPGMRASTDSIGDGAVLLFLGQGAGLTGQLDQGQADLRLVGADPGGHLGSVLAACGDVDGDGLSDWAAAAPLADGDVALAGRVLLARSSDLGGLSGSVGIDLVPTTWFGKDIGARAGSALDCRYDLTGDGLADLVVGVPFADGDGEALGAVHLLAGGLKMATGGSKHLLDDAAAQTLRGRNDDDWLGWSVATGDLDDDGKVDLVAGAPGANGQQGEVRVWATARREATLASVDLHLTGISAGDAFGYTVLVDELDGDRFDDLLVGAPYRNPDSGGGTATFDSGTLYQFSGSRSLGSWPLVQSASEATRIWVHPQAYLRTGQGVRTGDFDGDGLLDLALIHRSNPSYQSVLRQAVPGPPQ